MHTSRYVETEDNYITLLRIVQDCLSTCCISLPHSLGAVCPGRAPGVIANADRSDCCGRVESHYRVNQCDKVIRWHLLLCVEMCIRDRCYLLWFGSLLLFLMDRCLLSSFMDTHGYWLSSLLLKFMIYYLLKHGIESVSYTHLDVYKRQLN